MKKEITIDGNQFSDLNGFYDEIVLSPNFSIYWIYILLGLLLLRALYLFQKERKLQTSGLFDGNITKHNTVRASNVILISSNSPFLLPLSGAFLITKYSSNKSGRSDF